MFTKNLSEKATASLILIVVTLMYIAMCSEADIYVPAFPQMVEYFSTTEDKIQLILSINFIGLCLASLICGPLSDAFGRRKVLLTGLFLFTLTSIGCVFAEGFTAMLILRFFQGTAAAVPMVVGTAVFLDKYPLDIAARLCGTMNSVITAAMAAAPIVGAWLSYHYHWRANFVVIAVLALLSYLGTLFYIDESLQETDRKKFNFMGIMKDYLTLFSSFKFIGYTILCMLPFTTVMVYVANLSLIFVNHLGVPQSEFGYYQASTMATYVIFSALSSKLILKKGMDYTKNLGVLSHSLALSVFY